MKHLFLDSNVIIDFMSQRLPHYLFAEEIFLRAGKEEIYIYTSVLSLANCFYVLEVQYKMDRNELKKSFRKILEVLRTTNMTGENVYSALDSDFKDFEDALQNFSAENNSDISVVITRDEKDFTTSTLLVQTPQQFLETNNFN